MVSVRLLQILVLCIYVLFVIGTSLASIQNHGRLNLGFQGSQMYWLDNDGMFLLSNNSNFGFGFEHTSEDVNQILIVVTHRSSSTVIWTANRSSPVKNSDIFSFDDNGVAYLQNGDSTVWSTNTSGQGVSAMELWDNGNLVLVSNDDNVIWQSFSYPTDTLVSNQEFHEGMKLTSDPTSSNFTYSLEIKSGDMVLSAGFNPPQTYWSMKRDSRITIDKGLDNATSAVLQANSWNFFDSSNNTLWRFVFTDFSTNTSVWVAVLGNDGSISFKMLQVQSNHSPTTIPDGSCSTPAACEPYFVCYPGNRRCQCQSSLPFCRRLTSPSCDKSSTLVNGDDGNGVNYVALQFVQPFSQTTLEGCKTSCLGDCSCGVMFYDNTSRNCFMFNEIGSLEGSSNGGGNSYISFFKVSSDAVGGGRSNKHLLIVIIIGVITVIVILGLLYSGFRYYHKGKNTSEFGKESSEEDNFLESMSGMPIRFSFKDLETATNNFKVKLGQGGFGSVYEGTLPDGARVAVKQLEGIGQGKKEFRAEVSIIGSIHHLHLVRLKGFCAEGSHRLLVYEFMGNGSLEKWLFKKNRGDEFMLGWETRYNIAVGTAKGLAYLHEDCDRKIVHCDIKPENVLLDDNFMAKVSDFGLAKLMTREQSHVFTTLRGTRGYLAPEWITNYAISEKSDVYSYGMVLLELIGGRKNYDAAESSEKSHFPSYAYKMLEEGSVKDIIDAKLKIAEDDERVDIAIKVALWCIQDDMNLRPPMIKVVQMLEGLTPVPEPPTASQLGSRLYSSFYKSISEGTSSGPSDCNSDAYLSAVRLSGPR